jgi:hypothetical protein
MSSRTCGHTTRFKGSLSIATACARGSERTIAANSSFPIVILIGPFQASIIRSPLPCPGSLSGLVTSAPRISAPIAGVSLTVSTLAAAITVCPSVGLEYLRALPAQAVTLPIRHRRREPVCDANIHKLNGHCAEGCDARRFAGALLSHNEMARRLGQAYSVKGALEGVPKLNCKFEPSPRAIASEPVQLNSR